MGKIAERNQEIIRKHRAGTPSGVLSAEYGLSKGTVARIISRTACDFGRDRLAEDAEEKEKEFDRFRKIRVGDVVRVMHDTTDAMGYRRRKALTGTVVYRDRIKVTVQGEHYAEAFSFFDLSSELVEHIPS